MNLVDQVKHAVGISDEPTRTYNCRNCQRTFESGDEERGKTTCPQCGSRNVREVT